jgi:hypothetical protein
MKGNIWYKGLLSIFMMRFDQYYNESNILLESLKASLTGREDLMMIVYVQQGPDVMRKQFGLNDDHDWKLAFDRLVFSRDVVKKCVVNFMPFFKHMVAEKGPMVLRAIFGIEDARYDRVFEQIFDLVAVSDGAIYDYVYENGAKLSARITAGNASGLRKELGLGNAKYDRLWEELLGIMCAQVCDGISTERAYVTGLDAFSLLMNGLREHRSLRSYRKMWEYSEKAE